MKLSVTSILAVLSPPPTFPQRKWPNCEHKMAGSRCHTTVRYRHHNPLEIMFLSAALFTLFVVTVAHAQQIGTLIPEVHPTLVWSKCSEGGLCTTQEGSVVLDANWRWIHTTSGSTNSCFIGGEWDTSICPDPVTCAQNCALDGAQYEEVYGITTSGNQLRLNFVTLSSLFNVGSRVYLMASDTEYESFNPLNMEFSFDVDVSNLPCGVNGALHFSQMDADGGVSKYPTNRAGAQYGTGYCSAQCPRDLRFINGMANTIDWTPDSNSIDSGTGMFGSCCSEMDVWEANSISAAVAPHPCTVDGQTECSGDDCGASSDDRYGGVCDPDGCDFNSFRMGNTSFYGPSMIVDTAQPFTVVTQFPTSDNTTSGTLSAVRRIYVQNGEVIQNSLSNIVGVDPTNEITPDFCTQQKTAFGDTDSFSSHGGLEQMGDAFATGIVLAMSIRDDNVAQMLWLDSDFPTTSPTTNPGVARGTCATSSGGPADVECQNGNAFVIFSNIRFGPIGSTFSSGSSSK
ncbi:glycoside hydrolase family 7 protein [Gelatoporia subvermispora B]|uniref:Glucanase n=1 Tax=Ceriporiopsis subvermispora (strain B) TaxID=914234 RepID=M2RR75_CERS8|nr:glycoside hydrolase family 7 protein [Gelatoporia subvermispora B]